METFVALKRASRKARKVVKPGCAVAVDRATKAPETASARAPAAPALATAVAAPVASASFPGIAATGWIPPDCTMAVGLDHVLVSVNSSVAIYDKSGGAALVQRTLTTWFANVVTDVTIFDPKALYDQHDGRWVLLAVAVAEGPNRSLFLLSVSKTSDPMGDWSNYALDATRDGTAATNNWADYPGLGVDSQALYLTANMFEFGGGFQYAKLRIVPKSGPYTGKPAAYSDIVGLENADGSPAFTVQPCHTFGAPHVQYLVNSHYPTSAASTQASLSLWSLVDPLASPTLSRKTLVTSPFGLPPDAVQKGGGVPLDTGDVRLLNAVFRGGSVWTALTTRHNWGGVTNVAAIHWFQINPTSGELVQQGVYGAKGRACFYPALMPDANGNLVVVFARAGPTEFASLRYTGRRAAGPVGKLQASALVRAGTANYTGLDDFGRNRWGDYAGSASDPANGRVVWFYGQFATTDDWATWVASAQF